jgi:SnoaL-like domain
MEENKVSGSGIKTTDTPDTAGRIFYKEQIALLEQAKVDELIDRHYDEDAILVSAAKVVRGRGALKEHFRAYLKMLGKLQILSLDVFVETEDTILFEATVRSQMGDAKVYDAFVLRDGKATHHFTGLK